MTVEMKSAADPSNLFEVEWLVLPRSASMLVQNLRNLVIRVLIEQLVNLGHKLGFCLANLRNRQRPRQDQGSRSAAAQTDVSRNHVGLH
jgi:hypothetical protein